MPDDGFPGLFLRTTTDCTKGGYSACGLKILFVSAHPDDAELGCGGTIAKYQSSNSIDILSVFTPTVWASTKFPGSGTNESRFSVLSRALSASNRFSKVKYIAKDMDYSWGYLTFHCCTERLSERRISVEAAFSYSKFYDLVFIPEKDGHPDHALVHDVASHVYRNSSIVVYGVTREVQDPNWTSLFTESEKNEKLRVLQEYRDFYFKQAPHKCPEYFDEQLITARMVVASPKPGIFAEKFRIKNFFS